MGLIICIIVADATEWSKIVWLSKTVSVVWHFLIFLCLLMEGSGSVQNNEGSGRPKNIRIQRIRIHNTDKTNYADTIIHLHQPLPAQYYKANKYSEYLTTRMILLILTLDSGQNCAQERPPAHRSLEPRHTVKLTAIHFLIKTTVMSKF
jgi:hypothetical protein